MKTDQEIAKTARLRLIEEVADSLLIPPDSLMPYGRHIAKVDSLLLGEVEDNPEGKLILVTSMSPTPAGEGKTTLTIGLTQALGKLGHRAVACIRQPSLGPYFGAKGGATGSGYSQVLPAEDIAIQFTGDDYATVTAHNFISSIIDNHIYHGNKLGIDPGRILWRRTSTVNDRSLRKVRISQGTPFERTEEFHISAASEIMSALCLSTSLWDLKNRLAGMLVAFAADGSPVTLNSLNVTGAASALLKNAIHPNLVQSMEGSPVFVHGGPFGNISIGCSSLLATKLALKLSDYCVTEAGFATDLGAEKFFDIQCRTGSLRPSAAVIVATLRALRYHGGAADFQKKDIEASVRGIGNLEKHIENIRSFNVPLIVAINRYADDEEDEIREAVARIKDAGAEAYSTNVREEGGKGAITAAEAVLRLCRVESGFKYLYDAKEPVKEKISRIALNIYGAAGAVYTEEAERDLTDIMRLGLKDLPVCIAKTPKSLSDDPKLLGRPSGFNITVRRIRPATGAGFLVAECGQVLLMPGLSEHPRAELIDIDYHGNITGV